MSLKFGIALIAAVAALTYGAPAAYADLGDLVDPTTTTVDQAVEDTTSTVEETTDGVTDTVDQAAATTPASDAVDTVTSTVDGAVANTAATVQEAVGTVGTTVDQVALQVDDTVDGVTQTVGKTLAAQGLLAPAAGAAESGAIAARGANGPSASGSGTSAGSSTPSGATATSGALSGATPASSSQMQAQSGLTAMLLRQAGRFDSSLQPIPAWLSTGPQAASQPAPGTADDPRLPTPFSPLTAPAGVVPAVGAAGAALLALLLSSFLFATPRTGRRLRPGPILGRSPPFLSLLERPG
jgi:hypothetical protein